MCIALTNANISLEALARSVYSRHDIALLDDVMSALDAHTQEMIIQRFLSRDGIFRQQGTTVVLTTHNLWSVPESIQGRLIAVPQDSFTLLGTIRYNADIMGLASDSDITSVLKQIGLWAAIESRGGLDALLEDHPLSLGEQQLLCLARAILKRQTSDTGCQVLILDEATSSLDAQTDRRVVQKVMRDAFHDCTVFSVAHRVCPQFCLFKSELTVGQLDTIIDFDRIAVLDAGCLVEFDTPRNILAREGLFKQMYSGIDK
ncbi:unnamed protein product [Penicillium nalgiovense]|nr:unnamed protein product [Penicillium nalgiovense]